MGGEGVAEWRGCAVAAAGGCLLLAAGCLLRAEANVTGNLAVWSRGRIGVTGESRTIEANVRGAEGCELLVAC